MYILSAKTQKAKHMSMGESVSGYVNDLGWEKGFLHRDHERKMSHLIKIS